MPEHVPSRPASSEPPTPPVVRFHTFVALTLRSLRRRYRIHPHEAARFVGISDAQWSRVESGRSIPTPNHVHALTELLAARHPSPDTPSVARVFELAERVRDGAVAGYDAVPPLAVLATSKAEEPDHLTRTQLTALRRLADRIVENEVPAPAGLDLDNMRLDEGDEDLDEADDG